LIKWLSLSSRTACRIIFACAFSKFRLLLCVCVRVLSWVCVKFYCNVFL
jgi:hypothetical protein